MKILIDSQIFNLQIRGGISRYISILSKGLISSKKYHIYNPVLYSKNEYLLNEKKYLRILSNILQYFFSKPYILNKIVINIYLKFLKVDIFIASYYDTYFLRNLRNTKLIVPVYDMIHEKYSDQIEFSDKVILNKIRLLKRADEIIAISENTKKDILEFYPFILPEKIKVIYLGNSFIDYIPNNYVCKLDLPNEYFHFVGIRKDYKNFNWMVLSLSKILKDNNLFLVCVGGGSFSDDEVTYLEKLGILNYVIQIEATDIQLNYIYKRSISLILPSLYEGFGFPIIEAMSNNCLVVLNRDSCLPEIAGDAGCYYDVDDVIQFQELIYKILNDKSFRISQKLKGKKNIEKFTWEKCISETSELINGI